VPALTCSLCGRTDEVPKWHPDYEAVVEGRELGHAYICATCADRVRAEALRRQEEESPGG
jgi:uncharacterized protein YlaI